MSIINLQEWPKEKLQDFFLDHGREPEEAERLATAILSPDNEIWVAALAELTKSEALKLLARMGIYRTEIDEGEGMKKMQKIIDDHYNGRPPKGDDRGRS